MADYSVKSTQLSAPQGAGANPVAPTSGPDALAGAIGDVASFTQTLGSLFAKEKVAAEKERKASIVNSYAKEQSEIDQALATGQYSASVARSKSQIVHQKYLASFGEFTSDFTDVIKSLRGYGAMEESQQKLEDERAVRKKNIEIAQGRGFLFIPGESEESVQNKIRLSQEGVAAEREYEQMSKRLADARSQGTYDAQVVERQNKERTAQLITNLASGNLDEFQTLVGTIADQVRNGKMDQKQAELALLQRYSSLDGAITAIAGTNPELGNSYRSLLKEIYQTGVKFSNPQQSADELQAQIKLMKNRATALAFTNPKYLAAVTVNEHIPNNPQLILEASKAGLEMFARLSEAPLGAPAPQVVGDQDVEGEVLNAVREALGSFSKDVKFSNPQRAEVQALNSTNQILKQVGDYLDRGASADNLGKLAKFFSSREFGDFSEKGKVDKAAMNSAKKTFQLTYEPVIKRGIMEKLDRFLYGQAVFAKGQGQAEPTDLASVVDIQFDGVGASFVPRSDTPITDPVARRDQQEAVRELNSSQTALNQLIRMGAHLEGTKDYRKYWEDNKHIILPDLYPDPAKLKPGQVVNGMKYLGGFYNARRNWQKVSAE